MCYKDTCGAGYEMDDPWVLRVSGGSRLNLVVTWKKTVVCTCLQTQQPPFLSAVSVQALIGSFQEEKPENTLGSRMSQHRECKKFIITQTD